MKKIVLLSDGTGNGAAKQHKTNVWRLYQALDSRGDDQVAFYNDGVGAQDFLPLKLLGGAFGWGLKRNVVELYEALCRTYKPDAKIYLFGYSRGAFTVRMLAGMIESRGLYTDYSDDGELHDVALKQFEAYRLKSRRGLLTLPFRSALGRGTPPCAVRPDIEFMGVWDTVEAYGFPIDELVAVWDRLLLPLRFVGRKLPANVRRACHALAVDEERLSFRPVLFDESCEKKEEPRIEQVWFAGTHGDVGGGYPMHNLALVTLDWMISKVEAGDREADGLRFLDAIRKEYRGRRDCNGKQHDPRSGLGAYYRYKPRDIEKLCEESGNQTPKVHCTVLERIRQNAVPYAPTALPGKFEVVYTKGMSETERCEGDYEFSREVWGKAMDAALDTVLQRRWLYFALQWATVLAPAIVFWAESWRADVLWREWNWWVPFLVVLFLLVWLKKIAPRATHTRAAKAWWQLKGRSEPGTRRHPSLTTRFRTFLRKRRWPETLRQGLVVSVLVAGGLVSGSALISRTLFSIQSCCEPLCRPSEAPTDLDEETPLSFLIENPCFASGVTLKRGMAYRLEVEPAEWKDGSIKAGPEGFRSVKLLPFVLNRRHVTEPWLKLMGRVGPDGRAFAIGSGPLTYTAQSDGELFLYVNDAVLGLPWPGDHRTLPYRWSIGRNEGTAEVTISPMECCGAEHPKSGTGEG